MTGGNKGVGFGICRGLAKVFEGDVLLTARNVERGMKAVKDLEKEDLTVKFHLLDIDDPKSVATLAAFVKDKYGGIDVLVNNAAIAFKQAATEPFGEQVMQLKKYELTSDSLSIRVTVFLKMILTV